MELRKITIGQLLKERVRLTPDAACIGDSHKSCSWKETADSAEKLALLYMQLGLKKGDHAAVWGVNSTDWVITYLALARLGVISVLVNISLTNSELEVLVRENDIKYIIYSDGKNGSLFPLLQKMERDKTPCLKQIISMTEMVHKAETTDAKDRGMLRRAEETLSCDDVISILFTSGTSGRAKGVMLTHYNLVNNAAGMVERMHWSGSDVMCTAVPLFHCFGVTVGILGAICSGASLRLLPCFSSTEALEVIEKYRCTVFNGVPTFYLALIHNKHFSQYDISSLQSGLMAGSPIIPSEYYRIYEKTKIPHLQTAFGQTESSPAVTISRWDDPIETKAGTSGTLMEHVEVRIWRKEENRAASAGEEGEIQTRGYLVMKGYYRKDEETAQVIDEDGWLHTQDWGYLDEGGYLHVTGRIKDIILRGGENIAPAEIENVIVQMPEVKEVKVVGIKAQVLQEEVAACVIWENDRQCSLEQVQDYVRKYLADFKVPAYLYTFEEFPVNASGKVVTEQLKSAISEREKKVVKADGKLE